MRHATSGGLFAIRFYVLASCLAIGLGVAILVGGELRFSTPSFTGPRNLVSWTGIPPHWIWGVAFTTYGMFVVGAFGRPIAVHVLRFGVVMYFFLTISFMGSVALDPRASLTGVVAYTIVGLAHAFLSDHFHSRGWEG